MNGSISSSTGDVSPGRFRHAHQLEAYLGLVPREYSSGETERQALLNPVPVTGQTILNGQPLALQ